MGPTRTHKFSSTPVGLLLLMPGREGEDPAVPVSVEMRSWLQGGGHQWDGVLGGLCFCSHCLPWRRARSKHKGRKSSVNAVGGFLGQSYGGERQISPHRPSRAHTDTTAAKQNGDTGLKKKRTQAGQQPATATDAASPRLPASHGQPGADRSRSSPAPPSASRPPSAFRGGPEGFGLGAGRRHGGLGAAGPPRGPAQGGGGGRTQVAGTGGMGGGGWGRGGWGSLGIAAAPAAD